jgi:hypothetical protein
VLAATDRLKRTAQEERRRRIIAGLFMRSLHLLSSRDAQHSGGVVVEDFSGDFF